ncbi:MAG: DNA alkylation repair protein [Gammaproteobacteria bacterium]|nr:DNA alkylation repair protein [Gammaproteobacteria bacterium]
MQDLAALRFPDHHDEVLRALNEIGNPKLAEHIPKDRRSALVYAGVKVPVRRALGKKGFSFYDQSEQKTLTIWHDLFMHSTNGDVLFCAMDFLRFRVPKHVPKDLWPHIRDWITRIENWAHADELSWIYSYVLEAHFDHVYPDLLEWNEQADLWPKRVSIVSLIHYTGKNAVFLPPDVVLPMVRRCMEDHRYYMQKATGWVLREMHRAYPEEIESFLTEHLGAIGADALSRSVEKMHKEERQRWREARVKAQTT